MNCIIVSEVEDENETSYNFSEFFGKLQWKGDALEEQKRLRDEWDQWNMLNSGFLLFFSSLLLKLLFSESYFQ